MAFDPNGVGEIEHIQFVMFRPHLNDLPPIELPEGFLIRTFREGDIANWSRIETSVDEFPAVERAERYFEGEFGPQMVLMSDRSFMLETLAGEAIGTTTAWMGTFRGEPMGKIHWVRLIPHTRETGSPSHLWQRRCIAWPGIISVRILIPRRRATARSGSI